MGPYNMDSVYRQAARQHSRTPTRPGVRAHTPIQTTKRFLAEESNTNDSGDFLNYKRRVAAMGGRSTTPNKRRPINKDLLFDSGEKVGYDQFAGVRQSTHKML